MLLPWALGGYRVVGCVGSWGSSWLYEMVVAIVSVAAVAGWVLGNKAVCGLGYISGEVCALSSDRSEAAAGRVRVLSFDCSEAATGRLASREQVDRADMLGTTGESALLPDICL